MKKAMKQSVLTTLLNAGAMFIIVLVALGFFATTYFNRQVDAASSDRYSLMQNAKQFMEASSYLTSEVRNYSATGEQAHYDNYWNEVNNLKNRDTSVAAIREIGITAEEDALIQKMSDLSNGLVPLESAAMEAVKANKKADAVAIVFGDDYENTVAEIKSIQESFLAELDTRTAKLVQDYIKTADVIVAVVWFLLALTCLFQIISMRVIRKKIIIPVLAIEQEMVELSNGNLSHKFSLEPDTSEIGQLVDSLHTAKESLAAYVADITYAMGEFANDNFILRPPSVEFKGEFQPIVTSVVKVAGNMSETIMHIKTAALQVGSGADQVSGGAQALAQGATQQASSVEELSSTINLISEQVTKTADNAVKATDISNSASKAIIDSNAQMEKLMSAMDNINAKSAEISKIIKTIEDIAFQTNILALNAAVEAARAGAAGKGFAVVADEVRNLAGKSAEAAKNTTALIEESVGAINDGVQLAQITAQELLGVVEGVKETTDVITDITRATQEQANSISEITIGVDQISSVVQTNSATSEESAAAAEELSSQASLLNRLIERFQITEVASPDKKWSMEAPGALSDGR